MKTLLQSSFFFILLYSTASLNAQNITYDTSTFDVTELISDVLVSGDCYEVISVESPNNSTVFNQNFSSFGYFENTNPNFPFEDGIVLSSGQVGGLLSGGFNWPGDDDLDLLSSTPNTNNATVIEFQFIPSVSEVNFNYVFASNEYPTFVCNFSDIFAFILSGPGIPDTNFYDVDGNPATPDVEINVGGLNLALLPNTNVPVSITNVHTNENCFPGEAGEFAFPEFFDEGNLSSGYAGMTVPLSVSATVIPGETYTIKLAIADFTDTSFDSAVFLEGSSLVFVIPEVEDVFECDTYSLPETEIGEYFTEPNGGGVNLPAGTEITETTTIYLFNTDANSCFEDFEEAVFDVNIFNLEDADSLEDVTSCDGFILPPLTNGNYFTEPNTRRRFTSW